MTTRSTLPGLFLSLTAAVALAAFTMPPMTDALAGPHAARCQGYERLTILLATASKADDFSSRVCVEALKRAQRNF